MVVCFNDADREVITRLKIALENGIQSYKRDAGWEGKMEAEVEVETEESEKCRGEKRKKEKGTIFISPNPSPSVSESGYSSFENSMEGSSTPMESNLEEEPESWDDDQFDPKKPYGKENYFCLA